MACSARLTASTRTTLSQSWPDPAISNALRLINQVPIGALLGHREEAESAFLRLCKLFSAIPDPKVSTIRPIQKCQSVLPSVERTTNTPSLFQSLTPTQTCQSALPPGQQVAPTLCQRLPMRQICQPMSPSAEQTTEVAPALFQSRPPTLTCQSGLPSVEQVAPAFFQRLERQKKKIMAFLASLEAEAIGDIPTDQSRIRDLVNPARSLQINYRKGLSRRSLALEYEQWELARHRTSRVTDLLHYLERKQTNRNDNLLQDPDQEQQKEMMKPRRNGKICSYVEELQRSFSDKGAAIKGIRNGIKMLVFERLSQKTVVSAVVSFAFVEFRDLSWEELPELKETLDNTSWISLILAEKESWYQRCFDEYDCEHLYPSFFPL